MSSSNPIRKLSPAQIRALRILAPIIDEDTLRWPSQIWKGHPRRDGSRPTLAALTRRGLIEHKMKRMGGGIYHGYYCLTEAGREVLTHHV
jgi:hypothetical protein